MSDLFLDHSHVLRFEKIAMPAKLTDSSESWQKEVAAEVYKQLPYISDYAVNVVLDRVDGERGYAFGGIHVKSKSDAPGPMQQHMPKATIPVVVKDRMLNPLDTFMEGKGVYPLSEDRLREKLFRSDAFEVSDRKPSDKGMIDTLYPPSRDDAGSGAGGPGLDKTARQKRANQAEAARAGMVRLQKAQAAANPEHIGVEKGGSLIEAIAPTITEEQADGFLHELASDPALAVSAAKNEAFQKLAHIILSAPKLSAEKRASALVRSIKPTVVQFEKLANGRFAVKWANANAFAPQGDMVSPADASAIAGTDLSKTPQGGTVTVSTEKAKQETLLEDGFKPANDFGVYKVFDTNAGRETHGHVIPTIDFDLHPQELKLYVGQDGYSVQDEIVGVRQQDGDNPLPLVPVMQAQGDGCFVVGTGGKYKALPAITVQNSSQGPEGVQIHAEDLFGEPVILTVTQGLQTIEPMGEGAYAIPDFLEWLPLQNPIHLAKSSADIESMGQARQQGGQAEIRSTGRDEFHLDGPPIDKVARAERTFIKKADAEFYLVAMGLNPFQAKEKLAQATKQGLVKVGGLRPITPLGHVHQEMTKKAAASLANFPTHLRRNLIKEASVLEDGQTADKVLAMNFLNPENIAMFAAYLPEFEETTCKLAEMLVASRMGMGHVDEGAIERSMKNLDQVCIGLKTLHTNNQG